MFVPGQIAQVAMGQASFLIVLQEGELIPMALVVGVADGAASVFVVGVEFHTFAVEQDAAQAAVRVELVVKDFFAFRAVFDFAGQFAVFEQAVDVQAAAGEAEFAGEGEVVVSGCRFRVTHGVFLCARGAVDGCGRQCGRSGKT